MDQNIIFFLRNLADSIENKEISENSLKIVGEFYMAYNFEKERNEKETSDEIIEKDFIKFLVMGWYIYCILLKNRK
jgi:hypothetical protein